MATRLVQAGLDLIVYNRSPEPVSALCALGARGADTPDELFATCDTIIMMLADDEATDWVLGRRTARFQPRVADRLVINMGTHSPDYSACLNKDVRNSDGEFVEAPVSGSRGPAEAGQLMVMLAGEARSVARARPLLAPLARKIVEVGAPPSAMAMKMAVNLYLIATIAALGEACNLALVSGVDSRIFRQIIDQGPLGSHVAAGKLRKMIDRDYRPEASIRDVVKNGELVAASAAVAGAAAPLLGESLRRFGSVLANGGGALDMAAVVDAFGREQ